MSLNMAAIEQIASGLPSLDELKSGWKTSEFWLALGAHVLGWLTLLGVVGAGNIAVTLAGAGLALVSAVVYAYHRGGLKKAIVAGAGPGWTLVKDLLAATHHEELAKLKPAPISSLDPTVFMKPLASVPGEAPQAIDAENPPR